MTILKNAKSTMQVGGWRAGVLALALGGILHGQSVVETPFDRFNRLMDNFKDLRVVISLDRVTLYFPGEPATLKIEVTNRTATTLEIPDLKDPGTQGFDELMKGGPFTKEGSEWSTPQYRVGAPPITVPSMLIRPGQTITSTIRTADKEVRPWMDLGTMPTSAGTYRLYYRLGGHVDFEVGAPILEAGTLVPLRKTQTYTDDNGKSVTQQMAAIVLAVQLGHEHVLVVSGREMPSSYQIDTNPGGTLDSEPNLGAPWTRLRTIPFKVTSLKATANGMDQIMIEYAGPDGARHTIHLDANRQPIN